MSGGLESALTPSPQPLSIPHRNPDSRLLLRDVQDRNAYGFHRLFAGLPVRLVANTRIWGGYDNFVARFGTMGRSIRVVLYSVDKTPLHALGLSHFVV